MTNQNDSNEPDRLQEDDSPSEEEGGIVIEATWAPKDPRDKLYDEGATKKERAESMVRIFAAFHPVMNGPLLLFDLFKRIGLKWSLIIHALIAAGIFYLIFG